MIEAAGLFGDRCVPFDGLDERWRERAVTSAWIELGVDRPRLAWPTPECGTPKCLTFKHLRWESPTKLEYPAGVCVYCGVIAGTKDHLLPRSWTAEAARRRVLTVPACGECNNFISDLYAPSITERRAIAQASIRRRKRKVLRTPVWSKSQIMEMGAGMRSVINKAMHEKQLTEARLAWPDDPDFDLRAMHLSGIENPYELGLLKFDLGESLAA